MSRKEGREEGREGGREGEMDVNKLVGSREMDVNKWEDGGGDVQMKTRRKVIDSKRRYVCDKKEAK